MRLSEQASLLYANSFLLFFAFLTSCSPIQQNDGNGGPRMSDHDPNPLETSIASFQEDPTPDEFQRIIDNPEKCFLVNPTQPHISQEQAKKAPILADAEGPLSECVVEISNLGTLIFQHWKKGGEERLYLFVQNPRLEGGTLKFVFSSVDGQQMHYFSEEEIRNLAEYPIEIQPDEYCDGRNYGWVMSVQPEIGGQLIPIDLLSIFQYYPPLCTNSSP